MTILEVVLTILAALVFLAACSCSFSFSVGGGYQPTGGHRKGDPDYPPKPPTGGTGQSAANRKYTR